MGSSYALRFAVGSILREKWIYLLSVCTIASSLFFTALTVLLLVHVDSATRKLPQKFSVMVYLGESVSPEDRDKLVALVQKDSAVEKTVFISRDDALKELKSTLKDSAFLLEGIGENPLPDAIEIKFKSESFGPEAVERIKTAIKDMKGVQDVEYGEEFLSAVHALRKGLRTAGVAVAVLLIVGMLFVSYSTVKILFYRREREIETFKLLGATKRFIRTPFLIEGALIGSVGGIVSLAVLFALASVLVRQLSAAFPLLKVLSFPPGLAFALPLSGLLIGIGGAAIAIGRIRY